MAKYPFSDLHSFKDFVSFVCMCAPDHFPVRVGVADEHQWSLNVAFDGLSEGLAYLPRGHKAYVECRRLFDEAYQLYGANDKKGGFLKLAEANKVLAKIPTR